MSRLNTMYPDDEFLKNISDMMGKLDNKNETEIKQEIEQIGYKEFYRYSKEKDVYIKQLKEEKQEWINLLDMFKNQQKEFINYLEDKIDICDGFLDTVKSDLRNTPYRVISSKKTNITIRIKENEIAHKVYKEILQKYKSIMGVLDEKK